jgi:hypothetical protein
MLPDTLIEQLARYNIHDYNEVALREALEQRAETYTLIRLAPWPARRWKCHYRLLMGVAMYDAQSVAEAYARGLLALLQQASSDQAARPAPGDA